MFCIVVHKNVYNLSLSLLLYTILYRSNIILSRSLSRSLCISIYTLTIGDWYISTLMCWGCTGRCRPRDYVQAPGTRERESARFLECQDYRDSAIPCRNCFDAIVDDDEKDVDDDCDDERKWD